MKDCCNKNNNACAPSSAVYGLGFVGALVYYLQHAANFQEGLMGLFKALLWPALLIYKLVETLKF